MGTRHIIAVVADGDYRVAQYGQWDGDPEGQGLTVLDFIKTTDLDNFREKVLTCTWITQEQCDMVNASSDWTSEYPELSRDTSAGILSLINTSEKPLFLQNSISFAGESLSCEWVYVVDLDRQSFEVFKGFNSEGPAPSGSRFSTMEIDTRLAESGIQQYYQVVPVAEWPLDALPSQESFLATFFDPADEDEYSTDPFAGLSGSTYSVTIESEEPDPDKPIWAV